MLASAWKKNAKLRVAQFFIKPILTRGVWIIHVIFLEIFMIIWETQFTNTFTHSIIHSSSIYFESIVCQLLCAGDMGKTVNKQFFFLHRDNILEEQKQKMNIMSGCNKCYKANSVRVQLQRMMESQWIIQIFFSLILIHDFSYS